MLPQGTQNFFPVFLHLAGRGSKPHPPPPGGHGATPCTPSRTQFPVRFFSIPPTPPGLKKPAFYAPQRKKNCSPETVHPQEFRRRRSLPQSRTTGEKMVQCFDPFGLVLRAPARPTTRGCLEGGCPDAYSRAPGPSRHHLFARRLGFSQSATPWGAQRGPNLAEFQAGHRPGLRKTGFREPKRPFCSTRSHDCAQSGAGSPARVVLDGIFRELGDFEPPAGGKAAPKQSKHITRWAAQRPIKTTRHAKGPSHAKSVENTREGSKPSKFTGHMPKNRFDAKTAQNTRVF